MVGGLYLNKLKLFLAKFLIYGLGGIISKIVPLVVVPIVTRLIPNPNYYDVSNQSSTVVSFGNALTIMGIYDAVYYMSFKKRII